MFSLRRGPKGRLWRVWPRPWQALGTLAGRLAIFEFWGHVMIFNFDDEAACFLKRSIMI